MVASSTRQPITGEELTRMESTKKESTSKESPSNGKLSTPSVYIVLLGIFSLIVAHVRTYSRALKPYIKGRELVGKIQPYILA